MLLFSKRFFCISLFIGHCLIGAAIGEEELPKETAARLYLDVAFEPETEARLALSAAPAHLREDASVFVYRRELGFESYKIGSNGFTCLLNRDAFLYGAQAFKPTCWDREGLTSYVPVMLAVGEWLAAGMTAPEIRAEVDVGFSDGRFRSPSNTGVAYMIAGDVRLLPGSGEIEEVLFPSHHMYYSLGTTNAQLGTGSSDLAKDASLPFIFSAGAGGDRLSYLISMVGCASSRSR